MATLKKLFILFNLEQTPKTFLQSMNEWKSYLNNLDALLEEALKICLKNSLNVMYEALHGDGTTGPSPLLLMQVDLVENKVRLKKTM